MRLEKLEIRGFKSFKNKTVLKFPDDLTAIVGPNGSGKSNIIDAICFVLGRSRGLRANVLTDLIYNGGLNDKPADYAKVSMYLSHEDGEKTKFSREVNQKGRSVYRMNDKRTTRREILDLVGDNEYNILLQDDVTRLIDMKPKERREIIDDLCGIKVYDDKKKKAVDELEEVEDKISDAHIILGEKEGQLKQLKEDRDEAIRYQELIAEYGDLKATHIYKKMLRQRKKISALEEEYSSLKQTRDEKHDQLLNWREEVDELNKKLKEVNNEILKLEEERGGSQLQETRENMIRVENRLKNNQEEKRNLQKNLAQSRERKQEIEEEIEKIDSEIREFEEKLDQVEEKIQEESEKIDDTALEEKIDELKNKIFQYRNTRDFNKEKNEEDQEEIEHLKQQKVEIADKKKDLLSQEKELARSIDDKLMEHQENFDEYEKLKEKVPALERKREEILKELNRLKVKAAEKKTEIKTLESSTGNLRGAVKAVMQLSEVMDGIHGTVSQLGTLINEDYELAMQVAAGSGLQNVVVEDENVAGKCIEYLRNKKKGRATFLPLNKIKTRLRKNPPNGSIGFARDYIETKEKFQPAFDYIYRNTVLVDDLETAKTIGVGGWRMVTLNGDLIQASGAMTGGYMRKGRFKKMAFANTEELEKEVKALEHQIVELDGEAQKIKLEKEKLEKRLEELEEPVSTGKTQVEKVRLEKNNLKEKRESLDEEKEELETKIEQKKEKIKERKEESKSLERDLEALEKRLEKKQDQRSEDQEELQKLEELKDKKRNLEVEKSKVDEKKSMLLEQKEELDSSIVEMKEKLESTDDQIQEFSQEYDSLKQKVDQLEVESQELTDELQNLNEKRSELENKVSEHGKWAAEIEDELDELNESLNKVSVKKAKLETKYTDLQEKFEEYKDQNPVEGSLEEIEERTREIEKELDSYRNVNLKAIDHYEVLKEELDETREKIDTLKEERNSIFEFMEQVEKKKREVFMDAFEKINSSFEQMYKELAGGKGTLTLDNPRDISESGLVINASPGSKKLVNIDAMSRGEKVVTCSAFMLAIQQYKPSHFYIVDELDAALDAENSRSLAQMLMKSEAQFLLVSHNKAVIQYADTVIGVSMKDGVSQIVGVKL